MNCKPGDLVRVVDCALGPYYGRIHRTVETYIHDGKDAWQVDPCPEPGFGYLDEWLRPIRDPGDDAQDETLSWLPVPSRDGVPA